MAQAATYTGDVAIQGTLTPKAINYPAGTVTNTAIAAAAGIARTKLESTIRQNYSQTGTVVAATYYMGVIRGTTGTLLKLDAAITETVATGADRTVTIDLKKSTGAGAFASILSSTILHDNASVLRTAETTTFSSAALVVGDILQLTVVVAGAAGNQALGLAVTLTHAEDAS